MRTFLNRFLSPNFWQQLVGNVRATCQRFPFAVLSTLLLTFFIIQDVHNLDLLTNLQGEQAAIILTTGFFWFVAAQLFAESHGWTGRKPTLLTLLPFLALVFYVISHGDINLASIGILLAATVAITFAAWLRRTHDNGSFWYFNFQLLVALFFAGLGMLVLSGGLSLTLTSLSYLFEFHIPGKLYADIWIVGGLVFAVLYFLSQIPRQFDYSREDCDKFPRGVRFIQSYMLVPLSLVYMAVLYAYFIKILVTWSLPQGNLAIMVSWFGVIGMLTHISIYPIYDRSNAAINWFYRHFYHMMIIPLGMLALAIGVRINKYGLTEERYLVAMIAIWFAVLIISQLWRKQQFKLATVTISLAALCLVATIGPWNIHKLPIDSQFSRLETMLTKQGLLVDGKYIAPSDTPSFDVRKQISSAIDYLSKNSAVYRLKPWLGSTAPFKSCVKDDCPIPSDTIVEGMGLKYVSRWQDDDDNHLRSHALNLNNRGLHTLYSVAGYDYILPLSLYSYDNKTIINQNATNTPTVSFYLVPDALEVTVDNHATLSFDLKSFFAKMKEKYLDYHTSVPLENADDMMITVQNESLTLQLNLTHIAWNPEVADSEMEIISLDGSLLIKVLSPPPHDNNKGTNTDGNG